MLGHREMTMQDYAGILKRRFWLISGSALLFMGIGLGIAHILPPQYVSQTLVLIEQQKVPENYVKPVVDEDLGARLASMKEQILSRSRIEPIIERYNLYAGTQTSMDDRIDITRKSIGINPIQSGSRGMPGFFISFKARDARTAQLVCGDITSLFVSANLNAREESAEGTTDFLKQQLEEAKRNLDGQDAKLADFERKNIGRLPGQTIQLGNMSFAMGNANQGTLQALTTQLDAVNQSVNRLQQDDTFLEAMVADQSQVSSRADAATGASDESLKAQLKDAITKESALEALYTPDYPDVIASKRRIADLRAQIAREEAAPPPPKETKEEKPAKSSDSPQLQQLKAQLRAEKQAMAAAKQDQTRLQQLVRAYEEKIEASPILEEEYKQITRDHETALQFYNTLLTKMNESSMATALEHRQQGEQFRVMDAPNLPDEPTFPTHRTFANGGLAAGLALGLLLSALLEFRDTSMRNERDVWAFTKLPTLAIVSCINELDHPRGRRKRGRLFSRVTESVESASE
jgi:polysaccharide chain length determinant protein (PEP-CTERM system associated)